MNTEEKRQRLNFLCAIAGRALPGLSLPEKILLYEAFALVFPEKRQAEQAAFTAFVLAKADAAQATMAGILRTL